MGKNNRMLTLEQLSNFCKSEKFYNFSSEDSGYTLSVQIPGNLEFAQKQSDTLLYTLVKVCHTLKNDNGSYIEEEDMLKAIPTLKNQPLLGSFVEIDEDGTIDFNSHDVEISEENGKPIYIEKQIGSFDSTYEPHLEYDEEQGKTYVIALAAIPREYTPAAEIIERKNGTKVSCELIIHKMSYNAKEEYLRLEDFEFSGVTCLGEHIREGMKGSRLDIVDFSTENNSIKFEKDMKLIETLERLNNTLQSFNNNTNDSKKGGNEKVKFQELLEQYGVEAEDVKFEYEGLTDEELVSAFEEAFGEVSKKIKEDEPVVEEGEQVAEVEAPVSTEEPKEDEIPEETTPEVTEEEPEEEIPSVEDVFRHFELSLGEKECALHNLVNATYIGEEYNYYTLDIYEESKIVVMHGLFDNKHYKQSYELVDEVFSLVGDRVEVYTKYLTKEEIEKLDSLEANYSSAMDKLGKYEVEPTKVELLGSSSYDCIRDKQEFIELCKQENHFDLSVSELTEKADAIIVSYAKKGTLNFSATASTEKTNTYPIPHNVPTARGRYGGLSN